jgi:hypothetical protein
MIAPFITEKKRELMGQFLIFQENFHQFGFYDTTK